MELLGAGLADGNKNFWFSTGRLRHLVSEPAYHKAQPCWVLALVPQRCQNKSTAQQSLVRKLLGQGALW